MMPHPAQLAGSDPVGSPPTCDPSSIDWGTVLDDIGGDEELLRELVEAFVATYPETLQEIRQALSRDDLLAVSRGAHKLRGAVSNFGFGPAYDAARSLEEMAVAARLAATRVTATVVEREFASLAEKLQAHFRAPAP
jgi:HPt (histidine-containing phosphotransfer) domain-containing protein